MANWSDGFAFLFDPLTGTTFDNRQPIDISGDGTLLAVGQIDVEEIDLFAWNGDAAQYVPIGTISGNYSVSTQSFLQSAFFGNSFEVSGDGNWIVVGDDQASQLAGSSDPTLRVLTGGVSLFEKQADGTFDVARTIIGSELAAIGHAVDISDNGGVFAYSTGATNSRSNVFVEFAGGASFTINEPASEINVPDHFFGESLALSGDGNALAIWSGATQTLYLYARAGNTFVLQTPIAISLPVGADPVATLDFDLAGNALAVGLPGAGEVLYFTRGAPALPFPAPVVISDPDTTGSFGSDVSISSIGKTVLIADAGDDKAYIYDASLQTLSDVTPSGADIGAVVLTSNGERAVLGDAATDGVQVLDEALLPLADLTLDDNDPEQIIDGLAGVLLPDGDTPQVVNLTDNAAFAGFATLSGNTIVIDPHAYDSFTTGDSAVVTISWDVSDGNGAFFSRSVEVTIDGVDDAPSTTDLSFTVSEDSLFADNTFLLLDGVTDPDTADASLTFRLFDPANFGTANVFGARFEYQPDPNFFGTDTFFYEVSDGTSTRIGRVDMTVTSVQDPPVANNDAYSTDEDRSLLIAGQNLTLLLDNDFDPDGDPLFVDSTPVSGPSNGTVVVAPNGAFNYTPNPNFSGTDSFTYRVRDPFDNTDTATVTITVNAVNDPPVAAGDSYVTDEDTTLTVAAAAGVLDNDSDADGDALTAVLVRDVSNGTLTLNGDGSFDYLPDANFNGTDSFTYLPNDGSADGNTVTVELTVNAVNDPPVAVDDTAGVFEDGSTLNLWTNILSNDTDAENDVLTLVSVDTTGTLGSVVFDAASQLLVFVADDPLLDALAPNETLDTSFEYVVSDGNGGNDTGTVTVTVTGVAEPNNNGSYNGTSGADVIQGDDGDNDLKGGAGDDLINGGEGNDRLKGNDGSNTFQFSLNSGEDIIIGFDEDTDVIDARGVMNLATHAAVFDALDTNDDNVLNAADDSASLMKGRLTVNFTESDSVTLIGIEELDASDFGNTFG